MVPTVWLMYSELLHLLITIILCAHSFNDTWKTVSAILSTSAKNEENRLLLSENFLVNYGTVAFETF